MSTRILMRNSMRREWSAAEEVAHAEEWIRCAEHWAEQSQQRMCGSLTIAQKNALHRKAARHHLDAALKRPGVLRSKVKGLRRELDELERDGEPLDPELEARADAFIASRWEDA